MNRRGFIGGLVGLAGAVVVTKNTEPVKAAPKQTMRLRQVRVDYSGYRSWGEDGERVLIDYLQRNQSLVRKIANG